MGTPLGPQDSPLDPRFAEAAHLLRDAPWPFDFFHAVWLLHQYRPQAQPLGYFNADPAHEAVRLRAHQSLSFSGSAIQKVDAADPLWQMDVNFMGLTGPSGVLPRVYTEEALERVRAKDTAFTDFLDLFNHRALSLFYRAWAKHRLPAQYEDGLEDPISRALLSLCGLGTNGLTDRHEVADQSLVWYAGYLAAQPRSAVALEALLQDYFEVPVEVIQFAGVWCRLDDDSLCVFDGDEDESESLGEGAVVGDEVFDHQARVRLRIGPLPLEKYKLFLPGEPAFRCVRELTRLFSRDQLDFELQLILQGEEVPQASLTPDTIQLGWTTWVRTQPTFDRDPDDAVLPTR